MSNFVVLLLSGIAPCSCPASFASQGALFGLRGDDWADKIQFISTVCVTSHEHAFLCHVVSMGPYMMMSQWMSEYVLYIVVIYCSRQWNICRL